MKCTGKEQDTCRVEKMGCDGCYYDESKIKKKLTLEEMLNRRGCV
jgi:hypothetical protein